MNTKCCWISDQPCKANCTVSIVVINIFANMFKLIVSKYFVNMTMITKCFSTSHQCTISCFICLLSFVDTIINYPDWVVSGLMYRSAMSVTIATNYLLQWKNDTSKRSSSKLHCIHIIHVHVHYMFVAHTSSFCSFWRSNSPRAFCSVLFASCWANRSIDLVDISIAICTDFDNESLICWSTGSILCISILVITYNIQQYKEMKYRKYIVM